MKFDLSGKKAFVFDFDGVIIDSEDYKLSCYPLLFTQYTDHTDAIKKYIDGAAGIQRFKKFQDIYNILGITYTEEAGLELSKRYDDLTLENLKKLPLIAGVEDFLKNSD